MSKREKPQRYKNINKEYTTFQMTDLSNEGLII